MARRPGYPELNNAKEDLGVDEEREITRKWYKDASFEKRTSSEFKALREELRKARVLDFEKYRNDNDYRRLIHENQFLQDFVENETLITLSTIHDRMEEIGLSEEQFRKLVSPFGKTLHKRLLEQIGAGKMVEELFRGFTPKEMAQHEREQVETMKEEIGLQEKNIPHTPQKPSLFPDNGNRH